MAGVPSKHGRDQALDFRGFLNDLQDWELSNKEKDKKMKPQAAKKEKPGSSESTRMVGESRSRTGKAPTADDLSTNLGKYDYLRNYGADNHLSSSFLAEQRFPDAASEKEQGNDYFKQKKFKEAIDCYSRSIALSPTAVAYANRAMAYLKIRRFNEAEEDCTEALNLDDRYIKAYSRRAAARKELEKFRESMEDAEFGLRLEPHNQEIKKQYVEAKSLFDNAVLQKVSGQLRNSAQDSGAAKNSDTREKDQHDSPLSSSTQRTTVASAKERAKDNGSQVPVKTSASLEEIGGKSVGVESRPKVQEVDGFPESTIPSSDIWHMKRSNGTRKQELKTSVEEFASRTATRAMVEAAKNITPPNTAYQFEVSWRGFSGDHVLQTRLLKATSPTMLPQIFKNALTAPVLIDIVKCLASIFTEDMDLAVNYLENLTKVPRFDILIMCVSSTDKSVLHKIWDDVFCSKATPIAYAEMLDNLRTKYCLKQ